MNRYIIEFGIGMDFHGQNVSKAAAKAAKKCNFIQLSLRIE